MDHKLSRMICLTAATLVFAPCAFAQNEVVEDDAPQAAMARNFEVAAVQFDSYVYGSVNYVIGPDGRRVVGRTPVDRLESGLLLKVDELEKVCKLTSDQKAKLMLAGHLDIKRFVDRAESQRIKFEEVRKDQNLFMNFYQKEIQPLRQAVTMGLHGDNSIFVKAVGRTLDKDQATLFERTMRERAQYRYSAGVEILTAKLGLALGMTADQRKQFSRVVLEETLPPKSMGSQEFQVVFFQASKIPVDKFKSFLDNAQFQALERQFQMMRGWEQSLKANGYVPAGGSGSSPPPANVLRRR